MLYASRTRRKLSHDNEKHRHLATFRPYTRLPSDLSQSRTTRTQTRYMDDRPTYQPSTRRAGPPSRLPLPQALADIVSINQPIKQLAPTLKRTQRRIWTIWTSVHAGSPCRLVQDTPHEGDHKTEHHGKNSVGVWSLTLSPLKVGIKSEESVATANGTPCATRRNERNILPIDGGPVSQTSDTRPSMLLCENISCRNSNRCLPFRHPSLFCWR